MHVIDLRSDTCSLPDEEMRQAMACAPVGNESWGEDPSVNQLIERSCQVIGKEAALFMPSGTMSNLVALLTYADEFPSGSEVILPELAHTYWYETAGISRLAGFSARTVCCENSFMDPELVRLAIRPVDHHMPGSVLLWLENTYMLGGGLAVPVSRMQELYELAHANGMMVHLDGARIFNAALALQVSPAEIARYADSVQFCFSKGLGAPFGSILCGSASFIERAKRNRIMVGGGMRQAGIMARAALLALSRAEHQLPVDHRHAKELALGLNTLFPGCIHMAQVQTNIVLFDPQHAQISPEAFRRLMAERQVLLSVVPSADGSVCRFVTYNGISDEDIKHVLEIAAEIKQM